MKIADAFGGQVVVMAKDLRRFTAPVDSPRASLPRYVIISGDGHAQLRFDIEGNPSPAGKYAKLVPYGGDTSRIIIAAYTRLVAMPAPEYENVVARRAFQVDQWLTTRARAAAIRILIEQMFGDVILSGYVAESHADGAFALKLRGDTLVATWLGSSDACYRHGSGTCIPRPRWYPDGNAFSNTDLPAVVWECDQEK